MTEPVLRVGVDAAVAHAAPSTGHGRVWSSLVAALAERDDTQVIVDHRRALGRAPAVDVWLTDGHVAPSPRHRAAPRVPLVHDVRWSDPDERPHLAVAFATQIIPRTNAAIADATRVLTPSAHAAGAVAAHYELADGIAHPVNFGIEAPPPHRRRRLGTGVPRIAPGLPYVVVVGTVEHRKQLPLIRAAVAALAVGPTPVRLVLRVSAAPGMDSRQALRDATAPLGTGVTEVDQVVVLPPLERAELDEVIAGALALCCPSTYEGFGYPVLEAMALGTPVIATDRTALPEVIGNAGLLVEPEVDAWSAALARLAADEVLRERLSVAGQARSSEMTWAAAAERARRVLAAAASEHEPRSVGRGPAFPRSRAVAPAATLLAPRDLLDGSRSRTTPPGWPAYLTDPDAYRSWRDAAAAQRLAIITKRSSRPLRRLIDTRADAGAMLAAAERSGWTATGWERVPEVATAARSRGLDVHTGSIDDAVAALDVAASDAAIVIAADAWSMSTDVPATLRALAELAGDGSVWFEEPNWNSLARRRDGEAWHQLRPGEQAQLAGSRRLRRELADAGWRVEWHGTRTWRDGGLHIAAHLLVPWRGPLLRRLHTGPARRVAAMLISVYDRVGLGDVIVMLATPPAAGASRR